MARSVRIQYPGAYYHVMARGNLRQAIYHDDEDRKFFLRTLGEACERTGWRVHAWVLMGNHYHLLIETLEPNLVDGMKWLQNTYTRRYNVRHRAWGRVFGDRYKAVLIEVGQEGSSAYFQSLVDYIHLNPVRARLIRPNREQSVVDFRWSSVAAGYAMVPNRRPPWLAVAQGLAAAGARDTTAGRRAFVERLDLRAVTEEVQNCGVPVLPSEVDARCSHLRRGWYWGSQAFAEKVLALAAGALPRLKARGYRSAAIRQAHGLAQAERWLSGGLTAAGLVAADLPSLKSTDPRKLALAQFLAQHTTVSQGWLAERLHLRSAANVSQHLRRLDLKALDRRLPPALRSFLKKTATPTPPKDRGP